MKLISYFSILYICFFVYQTQAQCPNVPAFFSCLGPYHSGSSGSGCRAGTRWYYNNHTRSCISFHYYGCGGNSNRYCSLSACQQRCARG
ncbi:PI-actitoxin-Axm2b-like [Ceratitis capitata]|uniref:PI-actitoxin-Axm2b-like n=1 Tax=Ceratitis capitata TaxID=7213 RepID=UPI000618823A|nr:PI-actitoxin-Axm2b-like [Ceratitis capitata]